MTKASPPGLWRQRYEALRLHALSGRELLAVPPLGLHLLGYCGVAGWMKRWSEAVETSVLPAPASSPLCAAGWQEQLTLVLAQMTFPQIHPALTP